MASVLVCLTVACCEMKPKCLVFGETYGNQISIYQWSGSVLANLEYVSKESKSLSQKCQFSLISLTNLTNSPLIQVPPELRSIKAA